nr:MADS-box protein SOC1-like [Coffea arabica]
MNTNIAYYSAMLETESQGSPITKELWHEGDNRTLSKHAKDVRANNPSAEQNMQETFGEGLVSCTVEELQQLERQLERSVNCIRARKMQVFQEQIEKLKEKEKVLEAENDKLLEKCGAEPPQTSKENTEIVPCTESSEVSDVETGLFIGPPERRNKLVLKN